MKKLGVFLAVLAVIVVLIPIKMARRWPFDAYPAPVDMALEEVLAEHDGVRVTGTAHYPIRLVQRHPATLLRPERTLYLYPLFPTHDTMGRTIRILVASELAPEEGVGFEDMTVVGLARPPLAVFGPEVEQAFLDAGYTFSPDVVAVEVYPENARIR